MRLFAVLILVLASCGGEPCNDKDIYPGAYAVFYEEQSGDCGAIEMGRLFVNDLSEVPSVKSVCNTYKEDINGDICSVDQNYICNYEGMVGEQIVFVTEDYKCEFNYTLKEEHKMPSDGECKVTAEVIVDGEQVFACSSVYHIDFMKYTIEFY